MATNNYPDLLPLMERAKGRTDVATTKDSDVLVGKAFVEVLTEDTPSTWQGSITLTRGQSAYLMTWYNQSVVDDASPRNGGFFNIDVQTEFGLQSQEVRFLSPGLQLSSTQGDVLNYSASVYTRQVNFGQDVSDGSEDSSEILLFSEMSPCGDYLAGASLLDIIVNIDMPEA
jgi:hypothetical protein